MSARHVTIPAAMITVAGAAILCSGAATPAHADDPSNEAGKQSSAGVVARDPADEPTLEAPVPDPDRVPEPDPEPVNHPAPVRNRTAPGPRTPRSIG